MLVTSLLRAVVVAGPNLTPVLRPQAEALSTPPCEVIRARVAGWRVSRQWQMRRPWGVGGWLFSCVLLFVMLRCKWTPVGGGWHVDERINAEGGSQEQTGQPSSIEE